MSFGAPRFMPKVYRPIARGPQRPSRCLTTKHCFAEALEDLALAMRLNVELCDASEVVEKLDYRWKLKKEMGRAASV